MSAAGAAAAAAEARRRAEEEESMATYKHSELTDDWEFKILRSGTNAFRDPMKLRQALEEESLTGWVLVEKFDNARLRLKRPASARANDLRLSVDPYRTTYGMADGTIGLIVGGGALLVILGIFFLLVIIGVLTRHHP